MTRPGFRRLRTKIMVSFVVLMISGGIVTTFAVRRTTGHKLADAVERNGRGLAQALAAELAEPMAYGDYLSVRRAMRRAVDLNQDLVYVFVVDAHRRVVAHSFPADGLPQGLAELQPDGPVTYLDTDHGTIVHVTAPIGHASLGTLQVGVSAAWTEHAVDDAARSVRLLTMLAMAVGILGILFLSHLITGPLRALREAVDRFGRGERDAAAPVSGRDEVAELAVAFNQMTGQIHARVAEGEALRAYVERVLDSLPMEVTVLSSDGVIQYANQCVLDAHGSARGRRYAEVFLEARPARSTDLHAPAPPGSHETPAGRWYEITQTAMIGPAGDDLILEVAMDVTDKHLLAERLHRAERLAVAGEIAAGVVHTINNPLDGVMRAVELASTKSEDPTRVRTMLELAREGLERIARVTRTLLGLARSGVAGGSVAACPTELVRNAVDLVRLKAEASWVRIHEEHGAGCDAEWVDGQGMNDVLVNVLLNAIDACHDRGDGSAEIRVTTALRGQEVELCVADNGSGIPDEIADKVFQPFFTTKEVDRGTGLGLSVARRTVEAHGGHIELTHTPGGGATFHILVPKCRTRDPAWPIES